jgi:hypothetical protein
MVDTLSILYKFRTFKPVEDILKGEMRKEGE